MYQFVCLSAAENNTRHAPAVDALYKQLYGETASVDFSHLSDAIRHGHFWVVLDHSNTVVGMAMFTIVHHLRKEAVLENVVIRPDVDARTYLKLLEHVFKDAQNERVTRIRHKDIASPLPRLPPTDFSPPAPDAGLTSRPLPVGA